ncbi:MAG: hypothetical protein ABI947_17865 [Chloroflexota bacterium]
MTPETLERIATIAGAVLTVMVFSYLLGDNFLYRIAISIFIGASAAYVLIVALESVIIPWIQLTFDPAGTILQKVIGALPLVIGLLLLLKAVPSLSRLGNLGLVAVLGVGTALALWGAITGTLLPLITDSARRQDNILDSLIAIIGTITVLIYFTYLGVRRPNGDVEQPAFIRAPGLVGQTFIMITLGATYGLLIISALTVLTSVIAQRLLILRPG